MPSEFELIARHFTRPVRHTVLGVGDDGAIVRINGVEAHRFNMPATGVTYETRALDAIWGAAERLDRAITLDPTLVRAGTNVITVEVHQDTYGSSDLTFLASLTGRI